MSSSPKTLTAVATGPMRRRAGRRRDGGTAVCCSVSSVVVATFPLPLVDERIRLALAARPFLRHLAPDDHAVLAGELGGAGRQRDVAARSGGARALAARLQDTDVGGRGHGPDTRHV